MQIVFAPHDVLFTERYMKVPHVTVHYHEIASSAFTANFGGPCYREGEPPVSLTKEDGHFMLRFWTVSCFVFNFVFGNC